MRLKEAIQTLLLHAGSYTCWSFLWLSLTVQAQPLRYNRDWLQQSSNSCALAALSYALNSEHGVSIDEHELVRRAAVFYTDRGGLPPEEGYSVGDIRRLSTEFGVTADAWRLPFTAVAQQVLPVLLWMEETGRNHVVVLLGLTREAAHVFDPAVGHYWLSRDRLADRWLGDRASGLLIALTKAQQEG